MFLVDSHCHLDQLDLTPYKNELGMALKFAADQGIKHFLCVCITLADFPDVLRIAKAYPQISATVGLHPNEKVEIEPTTQELIDLAHDEKIVAIGETGLDYYRSEGDLDWQRERFCRHIHAAKVINKPLIIHSRQAREDTIQVLKDEQANEVGGVMHCFTEDWEMAKKALDLNFYISFSGIVTFANAKEVQDVAKRVPLDRMLIETDAPYLAPQPHRGKPNEPAYVRHVADFLAKLRGVDVSQLAEQTTHNFFTLFKDAKRHV